MYDQRHISQKSYRQLTLSPISQIDIRKWTFLLPNKEKPRNKLKTCLVWTMLSPNTTWWRVQIHQIKRPSDDLKNNQGFRWQCTGIRRERKYANIYQNELFIVFWLFTNFWLPCTWFYIKYYFVLLFIGILPVFFTCNNAGRNCGIIDFNHNLEFEEFNLWDSMSEQCTKYGDVNLF